MRSLLSTLALVAAVAAPKALAEQPIALAPSIDTYGRAEAVTADVQGSDALFYNPAGLAWNRISLRIAGVELTEGLDTDKVDQEKVENGATVADLAKLLAESDAVYMTATARAADLAVPYVAATSFARGRVALTEGDADRTYNLATRTDAGVIAGFALSYGRVAIGYAQYRIVRGEVETEPTVEQIATIAAADQAGTLDESTVPYRDFTDVRYGGGTGHNVGAMVRFFADNPSGIGVSVLNAGGTAFAAKAPFKRKDVEAWDARLKSEAELYGIDLEKPERIPEIVNVGLCLGWGGGSDDILDARVAADYSDAGGELIERKLGASWQLGLNLPDKAALVAAWPIANTNMISYAMGQKPKGKGAIVHMGLASLRAFGGYREQAYVSRGAGLGFHFGMERKVSVLKLDLEAFERHPILDSGIVPEAGLRVVASLVLMF